MLKSCKRIIVILLVIPIPLVALWVVANIYNSSVDDTHCGQGLSMVPTYWILEGPRIFVIVVSLRHLFFESLEKRWKKLNFGQQQAAIFRFNVGFIFLASLVAGV